VGARIDVADLPLSPWLAERSADEQLECTLAGGDDYELIFTTPAGRTSEVQALATALALPLTRIGQIEAESGLRLHRAGQAVPQRWASFDHFQAP
jgi:thiamine-monophosphate kinase